MIINRFICKTILHPVVQLAKIDISDLVEKLSTSLNEISDLHKNINCLKYDFMKSRDLKNFQLNQLLLETLSDLVNMK